MTRLVASCVAVLVFVCAPAQSQWVKVPKPNIPRRADGKPDLSAPAPRLAGKPDLSGVWAPDNKYARDLAAELRPDDVPFQPWAKALFDERKNGSRSREDNAAHCLPPGVPRINAAPFPWKIVQTPAFIVIVYETFNLW